MKNLDERKIYRQALDTYGAGLQTLMMFEEMSELQKELCKNLRGKRNGSNIAEEIADVEIMLEQMKILYNVEKLTGSTKKRKLKRLADRLGKVRRCKVCGCTDYNACNGGCYWTEEDICSRCTEVKDSEV